MDWGRKVVQTNHRWYEFFSYKNDHEFFETHIISCVIFKEHFVNKHKVYDVLKKASDHAQNQREFEVPLLNFKNVVKILSKCQYPNSERLYDQEEPKRVLLSKLHPIHSISHLGSKSCFLSYGVEFQNPWQSQE